MCKNDNILYKIARTAKITTLLISINCNLATNSTNHTYYCLEKNITNTCLCFDELWYPWYNNISFVHTIHTKHKNKISKIIWHNFSNYIFLSNLIHLQLSNLILIYSYVICQLFHFSKFLCVQVSRATTWRLILTRKVGEGFSCIRAGSFAFPLYGGEIFRRRCAN